MLKGKKTYITAAVAIVTAAGAYSTGDMAAVEALTVSFNALLAAFIRNGVAVK
jgi:hypothetical protein